MQHAADASPPFAAAWARRDLLRRVALALGIAERTVTTLGHTGYADDDAVGNSSFGPDKPLAETAMLLHVVAGATGDAGIERRVVGLTNTLRPLARSPRVACGLALYPSIGWQLAMPHILLACRGCGDDGFDRVLIASRQALAAGGREFLPHRALEITWLTALWQGQPVAEACSTRGLGTALAQPLDLIWGARDDAYALTHAVMYLTDFGHADTPMPRPVADIFAEAEVLLARALLLADFDLAAELLMIWPQCRAPWSAAARFGFGVLADLEDQLGLVPAGHGIPEKFGRLQGEARRTYALAASYHTAFVMGMLCAMSLAAANPIPDRVTGRLHDMALINAVLTTLPADDSPWRSSLDRLTAAEQAALLPWLLDMAMLVAARNSDFPAVARLLDLAVAQGMANGPLCAQVVQLLERSVIAAEAGAAAAL